MNPAIPPGWLAAGGHLIYLIVNSPPRDMRIYCQVIIYLASFVLVFFLGIGLNFACYRGGFQLRRRLAKRGFPR